MRLLTEVSNKTVKYQQLMQEHELWSRLKKKKLKEADFQRKMGLPYERINYIRTKNASILRNHQHAQEIREYLKKRVSIEDIANKLCLEEREVYWLIEVYMIDKELFGNTFDKAALIANIQTKDVSDVTLSRKYGISTESIQNIRLLQSLIDSIKAYKPYPSIYLHQNMGWTDAEYELLQEVFIFLYIHLRFSLEQLSNVLNLNKHILGQVKKKVDVLNIKEDKRICREFCNTLFIYWKEGQTSKELRTAFHLNKKQENYFITDFINPQEKTTYYKERDELAEVIERLVNERKTSREIAEELNIPFKQIQSIRNLYHIKAKKGSGKKYRYELIQKIAHLYIKDNHSYETIAEIVGLDKKKIKSIIVNAKIRKKKPEIDESIVNTVYNYYVHLEQSVENIAEALNTSVEDIQMIIECRNILREGD